MSESTNPYQRPNSANETWQPRQWKSIVVSSAVWIAIITVVVALILPNVRVARAPARSMQCKNNLRQIALALHNYAASNGGNFPPAFTVDANGKRLHSWRTLILAHIDRRDLYARVDFSKPWDDPSNAQVFNASVHVYACPSNESPQNMTTYQAIVSPESCFPVAGSRNLSEISDGMGQTLMIVEVSHKQAVPWMCPQDTDEQSFLAPSSKESSPHAGGRNVSFTDGSIGFLSDSTSPAVLRALISAAGNDVLTGNEF